jgi:mycothiol synthase
MRFRPVARPIDVDPLHNLFELAERADGHRPIGEHKYLELLHAETDIETGLVGEIDDEVVAYVALVPRPDHTWTMELVVHPLYRHPEVLRSVIDTGVERVTSGGGHQVRVWAFQRHVVEALLDSGFAVERELLQMTAGLNNLEEPRFAADIVLRPFRRGVDEEAWLLTNNAAFADHPENGAWTRSILEDRLRQDWFEPAGFLLAWRSNSLVGFCWTKIHDERTGEIYVIAVHPDAQDAGLGRALVLAGLHHIQSHGCREAVLYVDRLNHRAVSLYDRLGFSLDHVDRSFVLVLGG